MCVCGGGRGGLYRVMGMVRVRNWGVCVRGVGMG